MKTFASILFLTLTALPVAAEDALESDNFLGIWKTIEIDGSKEKNRAILVLPDRLVDVTNISNVKNLKTDQGSSAVRFVAVAVEENVLQCVLRYHEGSTVKRGRLTIRKLENQEAEIRYTLVSHEGRRWYSRYKVVRYEPDTVPAQLEDLEKTILALKKDKPASDPLPRR